MLPLVVLTAALISQASPTEDVFVSGVLDPKQPYPIVRIPALCRTKSGTLLAFAEGRKSVTDQSSNVLVLRRRSGKAAKWGPIQVISQDESAALNNPCVVASHDGIWLMYQRYPAGLNERTTEVGFEPEKTCRTFVIKSVDDGKSWSKPREISQVVKPPAIRSVASGPGVGIELQRGPHAGRLLFPFNEGDKGRYSVFAVYSDDRGTTWKRGKSAPQAEGTQPNECQAVELSDGRVLLNARNQAAGKFRLRTTSADGGETWDQARPVLSLIDPVCMGSIVRVSLNPNVILFSNPADSKSRIHGLVQISKDNGETWSPLQEVTDSESSFAYSCLCPLSNSTAGILYESVERTLDGTEGYRIRYATIDVGGTRLIK